METISVTCNSGFAQDTGYTCIASSCTSSITDTNAHSTATSQTSTPWHYSASAGACTWNCNAGYSRNGIKCEQDCPSGFIKVPGDTDFGQSTFCVAKYEMKQSVGSAGARSGGITGTNTLVGGTASSEYCTSSASCSSVSSRNFTNGIISKPDGYPITWVNQYNAIQACNAMGAGYHLATENEWMTIARNIELNTLNWNTGVIGNGYLYSGHNDTSPNHSIVASNDDNNGYINTGDSASSPGDGIFGLDYASNIEQAYKGQKRTLILSNGEVIWDFAGNVWEHVNKMNTLDGSDYNNGSNWVSNSCNYPGTIQYNSFYSNDGKAVCSYMNGYTYSNIGPKTPNLNAANGIGRIQGYNMANNIFLRGGNRYRGSNIGIYSITLDHNGPRTVANEGFRCTKTVN